MLLLFSAFAGYISFVAFEEQKFSSSLKPSVLFLLLLKSVPAHLTSCSRRRTKKRKKKKVDLSTCTTVEAK